MLAIPAGKARTTRLLAMRHPAIVHVIGRVEPGQRILPEGRVDGGGVGERRADGSEVGFLLLARDRDATAAPDGDRLLPGGGGELPAAPEGLRPPPLLGGCELELLLAGLAQGWRLQGRLFCLIGTNALRGER